MHRFTERLQVPSLLIFIALGMCFGTNGIFRIPFDDYAASEMVCSVCLIFVMFYGGFGTNMKAARPVAVQSFLLSTLGVAATAGLVGTFAHYVLGLEWLEGLLIGSVVSSTDAASVFNILRSKKLNLKNNTASLLELESGSNDPMSYMLTIVVLGMMDGEVIPVPLLLFKQIALGLVCGLLLGKLALWLLNHLSFGLEQGETILVGEVIPVPLLLFKQIALGLVCGLLLGKLALWLLNHLSFGLEQGETILVFAIAILAFALPNELGGNGYLSVYLCGILMGNAHIQKKRNLVHFFDVVTNVAQMMIFFLLGLLVTPSQLPQVILPALLIMIFMTFIGRPAAVTAILLPFRAPLRQIGLVSWAGLRGVASIVFAIYAVLADTPMKYQIFNLVFCIVLLSLAVQGTLLPWVSRKLNMIDEKADVRRTFTDYREINDVSLVFCIVLLSLAVQGTLLPWVSRKLNMIDEKADVRRTFTDYREINDVSFVKISIHDNHPWSGKRPAAGAFPSL